MDEQKVGLVVASNRLPIAFHQTENKEWKVSTGQGGLVTALSPILKGCHGAWIGWLGHPANEKFQGLIEKTTSNLGYDLYPVSLTEEEIRDYYFGFSNEILWPLFHSFETRCHFKPRYWETYNSVNRKFAEVIAEVSKNYECIWIQDYHLISVGKYLRELGVTKKLGFFLHIPFPAQDIFSKLPWRGEILHSLFDYDLVGLQTLNDKRNLIEAFRYLEIPNLEIKGQGKVKHLFTKSHDLKVGAFPISIDYKSFVQLAGTKEVETQMRYIHEAFPGQKIVLGVDRLDYTKGIPQRLVAFRNLLHKHPELCTKIKLIQLTVPSRSTVPEYEELRLQTEQLVSEINGEFGVPSWTPVHYYYRNLPRHELTAYYRASEIALVTPLRDGMNLVAKEYCTCQLKKRGVLILSEFAGAAAELKNGAIIVNPYDIDGVADAIYQAYMMSEDEKKERMYQLRAQIRTHDINRWANSFLGVKHITPKPSPKVIAPLIFT